MSQYTDKELLELAAKAAGIQTTVCPLGKTRDVTNAHPAMNLFGMPVWNPLTDDGDALRLAVKLKITLTMFPSFVRAEVDDMPDILQLFDEDPYAATRRAITRASAEIGKEMK